MLFLRNRGPRVSKWVRWPWYFVLDLPWGAQRINKFCPEKGLWSSKNVSVNFDLSLVYRWPLVWGLYGPYTQSCKVKVLRDMDWIQSRSATLRFQVSISGFWVAYRLTKSDKWTFCTWCRVQLQLNPQIMLVCFTLIKNGGASVGGIGDVGIWLLIDIFHWWFKERCGCRLWCIYSGGPKSSFRLREPSGVFTSKIFVALIQIRARRPGTLSWPIAWAL
jgi:hypothetical protein